MAVEIGQHVGEYEVLALLGAGGMGQVYSVRNLISGRVEAMKILLPDLAAEAELATRFTVEIRTLAALDHPNIAQLRTAFEYQNQLVMIMEFVEGTTLERLSATRPVLVSDALNYASQVLAALTYAHSKGVTHRDIKPANIMITTHGVVKLMDFGIAKSSNDPQLTRPGTTVGSVYYMSPEQVRGGTVDARSDVYSFGVTLYQMLTGRRPFQGENAYNVLTAQLNESPVPPAQLNQTLPSGLSEVVLRAMAKTPEDRYQSAEEFRQALLRVQQGSDSTKSMPVPVVTASPPAPSFAPLPPAKSSRGQRGLWLGLGAAAAIVAMIAAITLLPRIFATHASPPASQPGASSPAPPQTATAPAPNATPPASSIPAPSTRESASTIQEPAPAPGTPNPPASASKRVSTAPRQPLTQANKGNAAEESPVPAPASGPTPQQIAQARERMIQLGAKADAATSTIQQMRHQQQAQGYDMRGDVLASMNQMNAHLNEANRALDLNDLQAANDNMDRAERELSTLQKFLGR
jgi:serine/threonine-protein kinase